MPPPPLRLLLADDDPSCRELLARYLREAADVEVVGAVANGEVAVEAIRAQRPDAVFLDAQLPGCTGLEVVRAIGQEAMPATVFVTSTEEHAVEAFEVEAVDYLVKPVTRERLHEALERVRHRLELERMSGLREQLLAVLGADPATPATDASAANPDADGATPDYLDRIAVELRGKVRVVPVADLDYVVASGPYAELHAGDRTHLIRASMQALERRLDPERFMRVHRSVIVRLDLIDTLLKGRGGEYEVLLKTGARLRVSRARREALERRLGLLRE